MKRGLFATRYPVDDPSTPDKNEAATPAKDSSGFNLVDPLPGTETTYRAEAQTLQYMGKLTYQFNQDHSIALSLYGSRRSTTRRRPTSR
jgi:hypothetical protein